MSLVRFLMLLSLVVWVGGIIFFAFVMAPTLFLPGMLPARQFAGNVVSHTLAILHWVGLASAVVFLACSMIDARAVEGVAHPFAARNVLVYLMIILTLVSMYGVGAKMLALRKDMVFIDQVSQDDARRIEFHRLHQWSTRLESTVLLLGMGVIYFTARRLN